MKLIGAYITDDKDAALAALAKKQGFATKTDFLRALYDTALAQDISSDTPKGTIPRKARKATKNKE